MSKTEQDKFIEDLTQFFNLPVCQKGTSPLKTGVEISVYLDEHGPVTLKKEKQGATIIPEPSDSPDMTIRVTKSGLDHLLANSNSDIGKLGVEILKLMASSDNNHKLTAKVNINGFKMATDKDLSIPIAAAPTFIGDGGIHIDTTEDQFRYFSSDSRVIVPSYTACITIEDLAAADDNMEIYSNARDMQLLTAWCHCRGTCTTEADLLFEVAEIGGSTVTSVNETTDCEDIATGEATLSPIDTFKLLKVAELSVNKSIETS